MSDDLRVTKQPQQCLAVVVIGEKVEMFVALAKKEVLFYVFAFSSRVVIVSQLSASKMPSGVWLTPVRV